MIIVIIIVSRLQAMTFSQILSQGGPLMYVLLVLSVAAVAIVLLKVYQLWRVQSKPQDLVPNALSELTAQRGLRPETRDQLRASPNPVARVVDVAITCTGKGDMRPADIRSEIDRVGSSEIRNLESGLRGLSVIGHLTPLIGLLGTVIGMIGAFIQVQEAGAQVDASLLSGGIWTALLTTAAGLTVAIPTMAAFYFLEGEVDRIRGRMKDATVRVLVHAGKTPDYESDNMEQVSLAQEEQSYGV